MELRALREAARSSRGRFSSELREQLIAATHQLYASGETMASVGELIGISQQTVSRYLDEVPTVEASLSTVEAPSPVREVVISDDVVAAPSKTVRTPSGFVVEGLTTDEAVMLVRALS